MNRIIRKTIKIFSISVASLIVLMLAALIIIGNFILTPEKLTPTINSVANHYLKTKLHFGSVDISVFNNFPYFGITLDDGALLSTTSLDKQIGDTTLNDKDILVKFDRIDISVNPWELILNSKIDIAKIELKKPTIYAFIDIDGVPSWDIMLTTDTTTTVKDSTTVESEFKIKEIKLDKFVISNAHLVYDNLSRGIYSKIDNYKFLLQGNIGSENQKLKLETSAQDILLRQNNQIVLDKFNISINTNITSEKKSNLAVMQNGKIKINGLELDATGVIGKDTVNIDANVNTGNIQRIINIIPSFIIKKNNKFSSKGNIILNVNVVGKIVHGKVPIIKGNLILNKIQAQYEGLPKSIDDLSAEIDYYINLNKKSESNLDIKYFKTKSSKNDINVSAKISNLLNDQIIDLKGKINLDLQEVTEMFPLNDSLEIMGTVNFDGDIKIGVSQLRNGDIANYARIPANAGLLIKGTRIIVPNEKINLEIENIEAKLSNSKDGHLIVDANISESKFAIKDSVNAYIKKTHATLIGMTINDSTSQIKGNAGCSGLDISLLKDTIKIKTTTFDTEFTLAKNNKRLYVKADSLYAKYNKHIALLSNAIINLSEKNKVVNGFIDFENMIADIENVSKQIKMSETKLVIEGSVIKLSEAQFYVGRSDLRLTGTIRNPMGAIKGTSNTILKAQLVSNHIDVNELTSMYSAPEQSKQKPATVPVQPTGSTSSLGVFVVPDNISATLELKIKNVLLGDSQLNNFMGDFKMTNKFIKLNRLKFDAEGAQLRSSIEYSARTKKEATMRAVLTADEIHIDKVLKLVPTIDSVMPMIKSLSGVVSLQLCGNLTTDSLLNIDMKSLKAAFSLLGHDIKLEDSEAIKEISKMLFFKKKATNTIDAINTNIIVDNSRTEIFPFKVDINRYSLAVGGEHFFDNSFDYHISILKSPIPFKMGINVSGNMDKIKYKFGKAKFKRENAPLEIGQKNPEYVAQWEKLTKGLIWK